MAIHFPVTADINGFIQSMDSIKKSVHETMQFVESQGMTIENAFKTVENLSNMGLGNGLDLSSVKDNLKILEIAITQTQKELNNSSLQLKIYEKDLKQALAAGDVAKVQELTKEIEYLKSDIDKTTSSLKENKLAMEALSASEKGDAATEVEQLTIKLAALKQELHDLTGMSGGDGIFSKIGDSFKAQSFAQQAENGTIPQETVQRVQELAIQIEETKGKLDEAKEKVVEYSDSYETITEKIEKEKQNIALLEQAYVQLYATEGMSDKNVQKFQVIEKNIEDAKERIKDFKQEMLSAKTDTFVGSLRQGFDQIKNKASETKEYISDFISNGVDKLKLSIENLKISEKVSGFGSRIKAEFDQAKEGISGFGERIGNFLTGGGKFNEAIDSIKGSLLSMGGAPLKNAIAGINNMTKASLKFLMTPVGAVLGAIALALKAVHTWFNKSSQGQLAFAKISGYLSSVLESLIDIVVQVGNYLFKAFTTPQTPLNNFVKGITDTLGSAIKIAVNLLKGLGQTLKGIGQMLTFSFEDGWNSITEGVDSVITSFSEVPNLIKNAFNTVVNGVKSSAQLIGDGINAIAETNFDQMLSNINKKGKEQGKINADNKQLELDLKDAKIEELKQDERIAAEREKIYTLTGKSKDEQIKLVKNLIKEKYDKQIKLRERALKNQQDINAAHALSLEDLAKEKDLNIQLYQLKVQQASATRMLTRMEEQNKRSMASKTSSEAKKSLNKDNQTTKLQQELLEIEYANAEALEKVIFETERKIADAKIRGMVESYEKVAAERKREQEKELEDINAAEEKAINDERERQRKEFDKQQAIIKAQGGKISQWDADAFEKSNNIKEIKETFTKLRTATIEAQMQEERNYEDDLIEAHASYIDKKNNLDKKYKEDIAQINAAIKEAEERQDKQRIYALKRSLAEVEKEYHKGQANLSLEELKASPDYIRAFEDLNQASTRSIENLITLFEKAKEGASQNLDPTELREYTNTLDKLYESLAQRNPFKVISEATKEVQQAQEEQSHWQTLLDRAKAGEVVVKSVSVANGKLIPVLYNIAELEGKVESATNKKNKALQKSKKAIAAVTEPVNDLAKEISNLGNAIGGETGEILGFISSVMTFTTSTISNIQKLGEIAASEVSATIKAIESASVVLAIASTALSVAQKLSKILPNTDDIYEKYAEKRKKINDLRQAVSEYRLEVLEAQQAERGWFAATSLDELKDSYARHREIVKAYNDELLESQEIYKNKGAGWKKAIVPIAAAAAAAVTVATAGVGGAIAGAVTAGMISSGAAATAIGIGAAAIGGYLVGQGAQSGMDRLNYKPGQTAAVNNLRIQTRHKSFWRGQKTADLREWVKQNFGGEDLFDPKTGLINLGVAEKVLDRYGDKLVGETRNTLETLVELRKQYDEFLEDLHDYISQMYSPLVDNMADGIWDWLKDGENALDKFKEYASETFEDIGKEMVKMFLNKMIFDQYRDELENIYKDYLSIGQTETQLLNNVMKATDAMMARANTYLPTAQNLATMINNMFEERGFGASQTTASQKATTNATQGVSEDKAEELVGRLTAIQIAGEQRNDLLRENIVRNVEMLSTISQNNSTVMIEIRNLVSQGNATLESILKTNKQSLSLLTDKFEEVITELKN